MDDRSPRGRGWFILDYKHRVLYFCDTLVQASSNLVVPLGLSVLTYTIELGKRLKFITFQTVACLGILYVKPSF